MTTPCIRCGRALPADWRPSRPCPRCLLVLGLEGDDDHAPRSAAAPEGSSGPAELGPVPTAAELDAVLPGLEVQALLGEGGMGAVYRARQVELDRPVALKVLRPRVDPDGALAERFLREARALAKLTHPGIVSVYDFGQVDGRLYLVMELVEGTDLRQLLRGGELSPSRCLDVVAQMCAALQFAHERGVVHRDVKPENVLVDREGRVKIVDFGLAKVAAAPEAPRLTLTGQAMGTPQYMAPEQLERPLEVDHRADLYALGVVIYELFTGELPLGRFQPPSAHAGVDPRWDEVVDRALEKDPARRFQAASEIGTRVDVIRTTPPPLPGSPAGATPRSAETPWPDPPREHAEPPPSRRRSPWVVGCLVALLVGVLLLFPAACAAWFLATGRVVEEGSRTVRPEHQVAPPTPASGPGAPARESKDFLDDPTEPPTDPSEGG